MCKNIRCSKTTLSEISRKIISIAFYVIACIYVNFSYAQLQPENVLFSIYSKENYLIVDYILYTNKGKFNITDEVFGQNWSNFFLKFRGKIIGRYTFEDANNDSRISCELYIVNKKISKILGITNSAFLVNSNKNEFEKNIAHAVNNYPANILNSEELLNNKGYFLLKHGYVKAARLYLTKIVEQSPTRAVAYLNSADCYWELEENTKAIEHYKKYIELMKKQSKNLNKIPKYVYERIKK